MRTRLIGWLHGARESLWALPSLIVLGMALLALGLVELDRALDLSRRGGHVWAFGGGADGARGVLEAIAGSLVTVTGTIFSLTIVALQLASTQFTPRVLRTFTRDRGVQAVLGVLIGAFTYALLVLRAVRSQSSDGDRFVPGISVVVAILLALVSVGFLIYFIDHVAHAIRASAVIARVTADGHGLLARRFPDGVGQSTVDCAPPDDAPAVVTATTSGYLHYLAAASLFGLPTDDDITIRAENMVGAFVLTGEPLASVWPASALSDKRTAAVRGSFALGPERTLQQDVELPLRQLADIAVKALSPGVNDPTTAIACIDRLAELVLGAARRGEPAAAYRRENSSVRLVIPAPSFAQLCETAFAQVRQFGAGDAIVAAHLRDVLQRARSLAPARFQADLAAQLARLDAAVFAATRANGAGAALEGMEE